MDVGALVAVILFAIALLAIFGALYVGAARSCARGDLDMQGLKMLQWALLGHIAIYILLALTTLLT